MLATLQLTLFGAPQICLREQDINPPMTGKALALFLYLAVTGQTYTRDVLADLLWSELSNQQARNNLRYVLSDLRQIVGDYLVITAQTIAFNRQASYWLDVEVLRATLAPTRSPGPTSAELQATLQLYRGEFLAGFALPEAPVFAEWVKNQRAELHTLTVQGWQRLAELYWQEQNYPAGLAALTELLALEPLHEAGYRLQMRFQVASGLRTAALASYEHFTQLLDEQFGIAPEAETTLLYEQIQTGKNREDRSTPPLPGTAAREPNDALPSSGLKHNLPSQLTPLIGRTEEIAAICTTLLHPHQRLITLVGEGGIGKTRLALAVAQESQADFPDGVWFVPLAALALTPDLPDQLAGAIATAMQLSFTGHSALAEQLFRHLSTRHCLLILDSFEHLLDGADFILDLLRQTSGVKVLVTSRHILNFQAEYAWRVEGLPMPPLSANESLTPELLLRYDSVALFVERAQRVVRGFTLTEKNQQEVAYICQFVHGLPLGTELAAALTRYYDCTEIAQTLDKNYTILATAQRDVPARHRSIQATLAYSWSFLNTVEARVVAQCSLFRGGFSVEAAEQIMEASRPLLTALEDHSLLRLVRDPTGRSRYEMHELVRQYAASQLQTMPTLVQSTRARFRAYYADFMLAHEEALVQDPQAAIAVRTELNNLRQMWQWAAEDWDIAVLSRSTDGLFRFYYSNGMFREAELAGGAAIDALRQLIARSDPATRPDWREIHYNLARLLLSRARHCERLGRLEEAEQLTQAGLQQAEALNAVDLLARGYLGLAAIAQIRLDPAMIQAMGEKMVALVKAGGFPPIEGGRMQSYGLKYLGIAQVYLGNQQAAEAYFEEGLQVARQIHDREVETMMINNLGVVYTMTGAFSRALRSYQATLRISRELGERNAAGLALINLGETYHAFGDWAQAKEHIGQALTLYHDAGYTLYETKAWARLGRIAHAMGNHELAYSYIEQALDLAQTAGLESLQAELLTDFGQILTGLQRFAEAATAYQQALASWRASGAQQAAWRVLAGLAHLALLQKQPTAALTHVEEILATLNPMLINANHEPIFVYWICYRVLAANQDARAAQLLQQGYALVQEYAAKIDDADLRRSFLQKITVNQEMITLMQEVYGTALNPQTLRRALPHPQ